MSDGDASLQNSVTETPAPPKRDTSQQMPTTEPSGEPNGDNTLHVSKPEHPAIPNGSVSQHEEASVSSHTEKPPQVSNNLPSAISNGDGSSLLPLKTHSNMSNGDGLAQKLTTERSATINGNNLPRLPSMEAPASSSGDSSPQLPLHNKLLDHIVRTPGRQPSPQPTHLGVPGASHSNNSRILHETGPGYVAPKFEGKEQQMEDGMTSIVQAILHSSTDGRVA